MQCLEKRIPGSPKGPSFLDKRKASHMKIPKDICQKALTLYSLGALTKGSQPQRALAKRPLYSFVVPLALAKRSQVFFLNMALAMRAHLPVAP